MHTDYPALISPLSIAPMIDWTYRHFRVFMRLIVPHALLYTEMHTPAAVINNPARALGYSPAEQPLALQLGGADKKQLLNAAKIAEDQGFVEINLNLGCPSDRVQAGAFGACLMGNPSLVAECIEAMKTAVAIPVTAKTRIGIDNQDSYEFFAAFAKQLVNAGCDKLIIHARKAWLHGLNPKQNRTIPPLHYDFAYRIKKEFEDLPIVLNGNINTITDLHTHMQQVDGIMIGRLACQNPYALAAIHQQFYPQSPLPTRGLILQHYKDYMVEQIEQNVPFSLLLKPIFNLAHGLIGAKQWTNSLLKIQQLKQAEFLEEMLDFFKASEKENVSNPLALLEKRE